MKPNLSNLIKSFAITSSCALLIACGGGSSSSDDPDDNNDGPSDSTGGLSFTIKDASGDPVKDVSVSLYNSDDTTISKTVVTGDNGKAGFSASSSFKTSSRAVDGNTVTIAYNNPDSGELEIATFYGLPTDNFVYFVDSAEDCEPVATIDVRFDNHTANSEGAILFPFEGPFGIASGQVENGTVNYNSSRVCQEHVQSDNRISFLSIGVGSEGNITSYGFELDQTLTDGAQYVGTTGGIAPTTINFSTATGSANASGIVIGAIRKNVVFPNVGFVDIDPPAAEGQFLTTSQFPADNYFALGTSAEQTTGEQCSQIKPLNDASSDIIVEFADSIPQNREFDGSNQAFSWLIPGNVTPDAQTLDLDFGTQNVTWELNMPASMQAVTLPDLPSAIESLFDRDQIDATDSDISNMEISEVEGYDALMKRRLSDESSSNAVLFTFNADLCTATGFSTTTSGDNGSDSGGSDGDNGDNGGSSSTADLTLTGDGVSQLTSSDFIIANAEKTTNIVSIITFTSTTGARLEVFLNPSDESKSTLVSLTNADESRTWMSSTQTGEVAGVTITPSTVSINNVELEADDESKLTANGSDLAY